MKIFYFLFFFFISSTSFAHECILKGTSALEITIYNSCKADLRLNPKRIDNSNSNDLNKTLFKIKIKKLRDENKKLKNQLLDLKLRLNSIMISINSYINN